MSSTSEHSSSPDLINPDRLGLACAFTAAVAWGLTGIFVRLLEGMPPSLIVLVRMMIALLAFSPFILRNPGGFLAALRTPLGLFMGLYYILATEAFTRAPVAEVTLIVGLSPVAALGLDRLAGARISSRSLLGALTAIAGLALFLAPSAHHGGDSRLIGDSLALGAAMVSAAYAFSLRQRTLSGRALKTQSLAAAACAMGVVLAAGGELLACLTQPDTGTAFEPDTLNLSLLLALGLVSTALPTLAFGLAASRLPTVVTTSFSLVVPLWAALFAGLFLGEWPPLLSLPGGFVTLLGLKIVLRAR